MMQFLVVNVTNAGLCVNSITERVNSITEKIANKNHFEGIHAFFPSYTFISKTTLKLVIN